METAFDGQIVHYRLFVLRGAWVCRPAIVIRTSPDGLVLQVFTDGRLDGAGYASGLVREPDVSYSRRGNAAGWHRVGECP